MVFKLEKAEASNKELMVNFLKKYEDSTLFLMSNSEAHGLSLNEEPNSGNFKLIMENGRVVAVFCLSRRGTLLVSSEIHEPLYELILDSCLKEPVVLTGVVGEWGFSSGFWKYLKTKNVIREDTFISREVLYALELKHVNFGKEPYARLLSASDFDQWLSLTKAHIEEDSIPSRLNEQQIYQAFMRKVGQKISWGYFVEDHLAAIADLNAIAYDLGQVGGVYTDPSNRGKGYCKSLMRKLVQDAKNLHGIRKLIIFTGENNLPAQKVYESLGVQRVGHYALLFGR